MAPALAREADRPAMLENIAKAPTRRLLKNNPGIGALPEGRTPFEQLWDISEEVPPAPAGLEAGKPSRARHFSTEQTRLPATFHFGRVYQTVP